MIQNAVLVQFRTKAVGAPRVVQDAIRPMRDGLVCPKSHLSGCGGCLLLKFAANSACLLGRNQKPAGCRSAAFQLERSNVGAVIKSGGYVNAEKVEGFGEFPIVDGRHHAIMGDPPARIGSAQDFYLLLLEFEGAVALEAQIVQLVRWVGRRGKSCECGRDIWSKSS